MKQRFRKILLYFAITLSTAPLVHSSPQELRNFFGTLRNYQRTTERRDRINLARQLTGIYDRQLTPRERAQAQAQLRRSGTSIRILNYVGTLPPSKRFAAPAAKKSLYDQLQPICRRYRSGSNLWYFCNLLASYRTVQPNKLAGRLKNLNNYYTIMSAPDRRQADALLRFAGLNINTIREYLKKLQPTRRPVIPTPPRRPVLVPRIPPAVPARPTRPIAPPPALVVPTLPEVPPTHTIAQLEKRIADLEATVARTPDIKHLEQRISNLEAELARRQNVTELNRRISELEAALAELRRAQVLVPPAPPITPPEAPSIPPEEVIPPSRIEPILKQEEQIGSRLLVASSQNEFDKKARHFLSEAYTLLGMPYNDENKALAKSLADRFNLFLGLYPMYAKNFPFIDDARSILEDLDYKYRLPVSPVPPVPPEVPPVPKTTAELKQEVLELLAKYEDIRDNKEYEQLSNEKYYELKNGVNADLCTTFNDYSRAAGGKIEEEVIPVQALCKDIKGI